MIYLKPPTNRTLKYLLLSLNGDRSIAVQLRVATSKQFFNAPIDEKSLGNYTLWRPQLAEHFQNRDLPRGSPAR